MYSLSMHGFKYNETHNCLFASFIALLQTWPLLMSKLPVDLDLPALKSHNSYPVTPKQWAVLFGKEQLISIMHEM